MKIYIIKKENQWLLVIFSFPLFACNTLWNSPPFSFVCYNKKFLSSHNSHRASHSKLLSSLYPSEAKTSQKEIWRKGQGSACLAQCVSILTYQLFMAFNSKNCLPNITIRFLCSAFPMLKREAWGNHGKYIQLFSEYPPWCAVSFPGLYRTALNREHLLFNQCWSQPLLQSSTDCCGNTKTQAMLRASMHRGREGSGSNHHWHGWVKGW